MVSSSRFENNGERCTKKEKREGGSRKTIGNRLGFIVPLSDCCASANTHPDTHPDTYTNSHAYSYTHAYTNSDTDTYPHAYTHAHPDTRAPR